MSTSKISKRLIEKMSKCNINGGNKLLSDHPKQWRTSKFREPLMLKLQLMLMICSVGRDLLLFLREKNVGSSIRLSPTSCKTWIIFKPRHLQKAENIFQDTNIKITKNGKKHLGATIGSMKYRKEYINEKIEVWVRELTLLSEIAAFAPQEAYNCFTSGLQA